MKVLFNAYSLPDESFKAWGGPQAFTTQLTSFLKREKNEFIGLVLRSDKTIPDGEVKLREVKSGKSKYIEFKTSFHILDIIRSKSTDIRTLSTPAIESLSHLIRIENPDAVLLNGFSMLNWYILKASANVGVPVVVSHHGLWFKEVSEFAANPSSNTVKITKRMEAEITKLAKFEIFLNDISLGEYERHFGAVPRNKRVVIPINYNSVYASDKLVAPGKQIKIGFVGRWNPIKNPQVITELAKAAKQQKKQWTFYAVCKINDTKQLKQYKQSFKKFVNVLDPQDPIKLKKFYQSMNLMLLPSRFDVSPTVVLEAALQNRGTLISPNVGWSGLYRKYNMNDWISDFQNPTKTINQIQAVLTRSLPPKFINFLKLNCKPEKVFTEYVKVLKKATR